MFLIVIAVALAMIAIEAFFISLPITLILYLLGLTVSYKIIFIISVVISVLSTKEEDKR